MHNLFKSFFGDPHLGYEEPRHYAESTFSNHWAALEYYQFSHNALVKPDDRVLWIGESVCTNLERAKEILTAFNGAKYLLKHPDDTTEDSYYYRVGFSSIKESYDLIIGTHRVRIVCDPLYKVASSSVHDVILYSHPYSGEKISNRGINLSAHVWGNAPVTLDQCLTAIETYRRHLV